jgi:hypothetical protein
MRITAALLLSKLAASDQKNRTQRHQTCSIGSRLRNLVYFFSLFLWLTAFALSLDLSYCYF